MTFPTSATKPLRPHRGAAGRWAALVVSMAVASFAFAAPAFAAAIPTNVPVTAASAGGYQGPWLAVNPVNSRQLATSFQDANGADCWLGLSNDGGATWKQVALVGPAGHAALKTLSAGFIKCARPSLTFGPDGTLYYAYGAGQAGFPAYHVVDLLTSTDGGRTFGDPVAIDTQPLPSSGNINDQIPRMATDPKTGRLYVAFQQVTGRFKTESSLVAFSADHGKTFSKPVQVNLPGDSSGPQIPSVGPGGRVYVTFRSGPSAAASDASIPELIQVVFSTNHGASFSAR